MIKYSKVIIPIFRALGEAVFWITRSCSSWADPIANAICREGVVIEAEVTEVWVRTFPFTIDVNSESTKSHLPRRCPAMVMADLARYTIIIFRGSMRKAIHCPRNPVGFFNERKGFIVILFYAI
jgi:hypothetical protein